MSGSEPVAPRLAHPEEIPIVDVSGILGESAEDGLPTVASAIGRACRGGGTGFFYIKNHGLDEILQSVLQLAQNFFCQSTEAKEELSITKSPHNRGYVRVGGEKLDPRRAAGDQKEAFNVGLELEADDPENVQGAPFRGINVWPHKGASEFRATLLTYYDVMQQLGRNIMRAIALDLGASPPNQHFDSLIHRGMSILRLLHYPKTSSLQPKEGAIAAGQHRDYGLITLLATDGVPGLEVRTRDGEWVQAPSIPGTLIVNVGDCLMRISNDQYVSTPHRVVNRAGLERYSIAYFLELNPNAIVECMPSCSSLKNPPKYRPCSAAAFLKARLDATYSFRTEERPSKL